jgi:pyruvate/2-oxoglutarate/acetoin dehydrogenase E1 component
VGAVLSYFQELIKAMGMLSGHPKTIFVGQAVKYDGQAAYETFKEVPEDKKVELPVCEDFQMGYCTGLALNGYIPVSFYPRFDFLILAMNQLVNHLDKIPLMGGFRPKVIIRTAVGRSKPLYPGPQHVQDYTDAMNMMLRSVRVIEVLRAGDVMPAYITALGCQESVLVVEHMSQY